MTYEKTCSFVRLQIISDYFIGRKETLFSYLCHNRIVYQSQSITINTVDFVGLTFHSKEGIVSWNHLPANRERWGSAMQNLDPTTKSLSWRQVSEILGVCIWDWWVSGENRSQIKLVLRAAQATGKLCSAASDWDRISRLSARETLDLISYVSNLAGTTNLKTRPVSNAIQSRSFKEGVVVIACSDAMSIRGAGITFTPEGTRNFLSGTQQRPMSPSTGERR